MESILPGNVLASATVFRLMRSDCLRLFQDDAKGAIRMARRLPIALQGQACCAA